jgi:hypothetical protein
MGWAHVNAAPRPRCSPRPALFVVQYRDGRRPVMKVPMEVGHFALAPAAVLRTAQARQAAGELPAGEIERLVRIR